MPTVLLPVLLSSDFSMVGSPPRPSPGTLPILACLAAACLALAGCDRKPAQPQDTSPVSKPVSSPSAGLNTGLVAHWTFDEGVGDVAKDVTGNGHDAKLKNTGWVVSPRGHALRFTGKDSLADYGGIETLNRSGDLTLAVWVKMDSGVAPATHRLIFGDAGLAVMRNANLAVNSKQLLNFEWGDGKSSASLDAPGTLMNGAWKHVVVVANSKEREITMVVDGEVVAKMEMPMPITKTAAKQRLTGWFYNGFFQGDLDDIRLYSRALALNEVQELFRSQADLTVSQAVVLRDASTTDPRGFAAVAVKNLGREPRRIKVSGTEKREIVLKPGEETQVTLGGIPLQPVFPGRTDLYVCDSTQTQDRITVFGTSGDVAESDEIRPSLPKVFEPLQVVVHDPWQAGMKPGKTDRVNLGLKLAVPDDQLAKATLRVRLVSRESGKEVLAQDLASPKAAQSLALDVKDLPWGAYDLIASFHNAAGTEIAGTKGEVTILPDGAQQIRVLNNLVSELMDARAAGLLASPRIEFMNPRKGWVWIRAAGGCEVKLGGESLLRAEEGKPAVEAMRLLPAGRHVLEISGTPADLNVRAIPALVYNIFPSTPKIKEFGENTWERLRKHMLPNCNMIESNAVDTPEYKEWVAQGKLWFPHVQAPGLLDEKPWTPESLTELWLNPGKSTAWPEIPDLTLTKISGVQVDEYGEGMKSVRYLLPLALSIARLSEDPAFAGKLWIPFMTGKFGTKSGDLLLRTVLAAGWPFSEEVYVGEMSTGAENRENIRANFLSVATAYNSACPGSVRGMIFTPMYSSLPYCSANRSPQADFRVHLDMQMQLLATDPSFFGLWGVQPYRSNYVNEEILNAMGMLLRHYAIDGKTERMVSDPYELRHVANPDFEEGTKQWEVAAAEEGAVSPGKFVGYGNLQGRFPNGTMGDTFAVMKRSATAANVLSQEITGLTPGRLYSLKLITGDYADLKSGKSRNAAVPLSVAVEGAAVQTGSFSQPFPSFFGPKPFTAKETFWMTYHYLTFRASGPTARLMIKDWPSDTDPGGPAGQQVMVNFVELQPVLESER
jgi:hypothetical protein